jgi:hypothetical protein
MHVKYSALRATAGSSIALSCLAAFALAGPLAISTFQSVQERGSVHEDSTSITAMLWKGSGGGWGAGDIGPRARA